MKNLYLDINGVLLTYLQHEKELRRLLAILQESDKPNTQIIV